MNETLKKHKFDVWYYIGVMTFAGMAITAIGTVFYLIFRKKTTSEKDCTIRLNQFKLTGTTNEQGECEIFDFKLF